MAAAIDYHVHVVVGRRCVRCGVEYTPEEVASGQAFRPSGRKMHLASVCRPCEERERDERKGTDRFAVKANDTRRRHAIRLSHPRSANGVVAWHDPHLTATKLELVYGWAQKQMRHDFEFKYGNGCDYCHQSYAGMGHGYADETLDIYDPRLAPHYTNTRHCCLTCQRRKGLLTPEQWAIKLGIYRKWETAQFATAEELGMLMTYAQWSGDGPR